MIKTRYDTDYPEATRMSYRLLKKSGRPLRITEFWGLLCTVFGVKEFEILDLRSPHIGEYESYLIDNLIEWRDGKPIDFGELEESIFTFGEFTEMEKLLLTTNELQERLWAIYLSLIDPDLNL